MPSIPTSQIKQHSTNQAWSTFHVLQTNAAEFGQHAVIIILNTQYEELISIGKIIHIGLSVYLSTNHVHWKSHNNRKNLSKNAIHNLGWCVLFLEHFYTMNK
jgi:hypothetical protein